jgi:hypothetical protein
MSLLIFALVVVIVACLGLWLVRSIPMDGNLSTICQIAVIVIAIIAIASKAGWV